jgi:hypothetical protein
VTGSFANLGQEGRCFIAETRSLQPMRKRGTAGLGRRRTGAGRQVREDAVAGAPSAGFAAEVDGRQRACAPRPGSRDQRPPWLGLLLWALACVGLFVSLLMNADEVGRTPRLASREVVQAERPIVPHAFVTGKFEKVG